jgi:hypothetical protein
MIMMAKSSLLGWASDVTPMRAKRNLLKNFVGKPEGKKIFKGLGINGWIIVKWVNTWIVPQPLTFAAFPIHHPLTSYSLTMQVQYLRS